MLTLLDTTGDDWDGGCDDGHTGRGKAIRIVCTNVRMSQEYTEAQEAMFTVNRSC